MRTFAACAAFFVLPAMATPLRAQTLDELYEKAKAEKTLVIYKGGPVAEYEKWGKEFEAKYPGVKVSVTGGFSNVLDVQIDKQIAEKKLEADFAVFQTIQDFVRWKNEGALALFKPLGWEHIDDQFKDVDGAYVAVGVNAMPYAYNPQLVKPEDVPKSAPDFLKPMFKGKLITAYPADDDATLYDLYQVVQKYGWEYMDKYMANQPSFIQGHLGVARSIGSGESLVTIDAIAGTSMEANRSGLPQAIWFSQIDPVPVWALSGAIFKDAPHPNAARLFLDWFLDLAQQSRISYWSPRSDAPPPPGLKPILSYKIVNTYRELLTNEPLMADLRKRFEAYTGPVKNAGGVR
jgi:ABC-type Fe3+ transport system substrate-binding protein